MKPVCLSCENSGMYYLRVPEGGFEGHKIMGEFRTSNEGPIEGPWQVTIPVGLLE